MSEDILLDLPLREVLRRLANLPDAFVLGDEERTFCGAFAEEFSWELDPEPGLSLGAPGGAFPKWVGVLPYEVFRGQERTVQTDRREAPLIERPMWARYAAVAELGAHGVRILGDGPAVRRLARSLEAHAVPRPAPRLKLAYEEPTEAHEQRIREALRLIERGDLYQVNLSRRAVFEAEGHPLDMLLRLGQTGQAPFSAALSLPGVQLVSGSPELCLHLLADRTVLTRPIKGTRPRGTSTETDERLARELDGSEKERAELAMVVDIERNDLGRISEPGSVRLVEPPHIVSHSTVHHREATVAARLRAGVSRTDLLHAFLPSGSVTGAPKIRAMDLIRELETERRGLYTGALGFLAHDGSLRLSMAIRVLTLRDRIAHYHAGGGIVADSNPRQELEETRWKSAMLEPLLRA